MNRRRLMLAAPLAAALVAAGGITAVGAQQPPPKRWGPGMTAADYAKVKPGDTVPALPGQVLPPQPGVDPAAVQAELREALKATPADASRFAGMSGEEVAAQLDREARQRPPTAGAGPEKGATVRIAGKAVTLPADAWVEATVYGRPGADAQGRLIDADGKPLPLPYDAVRLIVRRGAAAAFVGASTGRVLRVDPPEREADFAFLKDALK